MADKGGTKGWIDIHTHISPGVDDGASDWKEIGEMFCKAHKQGITHIIAAPHYISGQDIKRLREIIRRLKETAFSIPGNMMVNLGQEVQYFEELPSFLEQGEALTLAGSRYVLVEFLPGDGYIRLFRAVRRLVQSPYLPVIAHTERYDCLKEEGRTKELARCGAYLQMDTGSLGGGFFDRRTAQYRKEISGGSIHFVATDMYGVVIRPPELEEVVRWMTKWDRNGQDAGRTTGRLLRRSQEHILGDPVL